MPVTSYLCVGGEVLSETRGGADRDYLPDPLGSVVALLDASQARTDAFACWPFGEERSRSGSTPTPFRFVGTLGYYADQPSQRLYVRARHHRPALARWQTADPLWPAEPPYAYAGDSPASRVDWLGTSTQDIVYDCDAGTVPSLSQVSGVMEGACSKIISCWNDPKCYNLMLKCWTSSGYDPKKAQDAVACMVGYCAGYKTINISCGGSLCCTSTKCGYTLNYGCRIHICPVTKSNPTCSNYEDTMIHELSHCCGSSDDDEQANQIAACYDAILRVHR